ncbi:MAG: hypothetical protein ACHQ0J_07930 [Candidatus Dormibacterales bacterium]
MLITHVKPTDLWGKKVYDSDGLLLGEVVAIASRRGVVRKVVVQRSTEKPVLSVVPPADTRVVHNRMLLPGPAPIRRPELRLVR